MTDSYKILCACCRRALFLYAGDFVGPIRPNQFQPFPSVPKPAPREPLLCPFCGKEWYLVNARTGGLTVLTDKGFKPRDPISGGREQVSQPRVEPELPPELRGAASEFTDPSVHNIKEP